MILLRALVAISSTLGFVILGCVIAWRDPSRRRLSRIPTPLVLTGGTLVALGLSLRAWATWVFWSRGHGTPVPPLVPAYLVTAGPYAFTRNPLYLGTVATSVGMGLLLRSPLLLVTTLVGCFVLCWFVVFWEEDWLRQRYGEAYDRYRQRVPRWFKPTFRT